MHVIYLYFELNIIVFYNPNPTIFPRLFRREGIIHLEVGLSNRIVAADNDPLPHHLREFRPCSADALRGGKHVLGFIRSRTRARINFSSKEKPDPQIQHPGRQTSRRRLVASIRPIPRDKIAITRRLLDEISTIHAPGVNETII